ncbi:hypothetical protein ADN00_01925 [Ornatilinea apprima]|uniref:Glycosyltransferase subfamily 4-like N-terminal domain-containing protein n=1 Tax=Ornatilinea apprima TaxID=1134406 RepID=A0A0P6XJA5_9CHLR|nr:glycosyltransferase family 4 protein [Ornatilinea apprima]KPL80053.1 hypothetical protein ADN00_01925 [Ornatilinea apprima]
MRILVLTHEYPPVGGGGGRVAQDVCAGLAARGHEVRVLTAHCADLPFYEKRDGVEVLFLKSGRAQLFRASLKAMAGYVWQAFWQGLKQIRAWKPDVIHAQFAVPAGAAAWALSLVTGTPYVLTAHLGDVPGGTPEKTGKWFQMIYPFTPPIWKRAARVTAVSAFTRDLALKHYPVAVQVIPNGVDLQAVSAGEITLHQPPVVVFAGRFMQQKNVVQIARVMNRLADLDWRCLMLGDGPLKAEVEAEIARGGCAERFELPGWVTPQQVLEAFEQADILLMPSYSEGLPVVGVQAMAKGLALALSGAGGNPELVEAGRNGVLLEPEDEAGYEAALRVWLSDPEKLLAARRASRELAQRFDLGKIVDEYEQVLRAAAR